VQRPSLSAVEKTGKDEDHRFHLYVRPMDAKAEQWDGARSGTQAALDVFNADEVRKDGYATNCDADIQFYRLET